MFEKLKVLLKTKKTKNDEKHIIVCIHGFGIRTIHQFDNFKLWNQNKLPLYTFNIFVKENENDCNPSIWLSRCESVVNNFINAGYNVDLVGFSMGGVIASYLASKYKIGRLFLIAPAFEYLTPSNVISKTKEILKKKEESTLPTLPPSFTSCFIEIVKQCKDSIKSVTCPVCIVHGNKDEVIPYKSSMNTYEQIPHDKKRLFIIHDGDHHLMTNIKTGYETYLLFEQFMNHQILQDSEIEFSKDIYE